MLREALWKGTENLITRSKIGHTPLFLLEVTYRKGFDGIAGALDEKICLRDASGMPLDAEAQLALRSLDGVRLDVGKAAEAVVRHLQDVERVLCRRASPFPSRGRKPSPRSMSDGFGKSDERAGPISGTGVSEPGASAKEVTTVAAIFEARSPLAMFRKPYTTTSSVSFPFPPPTALAGSMAAVVGEGNGAGKEAFCAAFWKNSRAPGWRSASCVPSPGNGARSTSGTSRNPQKTRTSR